MSSVKRTRLLRPGTSRNPCTTYWIAPRLPTLYICASSRSKVVVSAEPAGAAACKGAKLDVPTRPTRNLTRSIDARSRRLSEVNCCREPIPALVRMTATRSPGCISLSTHFFSESFTRTTLSNESPRSSTTSAIVRRTCCGRSPPLVGRGGAGGPPRGATGAATPRAGEALMSTNSKLEIICGFPSWNTSKSSALRSVTGFPLESVTIAST